MKLDKSRFNEMLTFQPNNIYINIDFESIKNKLLKYYTNVKDYGSSVIIDDGRFVISLNKIGTLQMFYNNTDVYEEANEIQKIESVFKEQIPQFKLIQ